MTIAPLIEIPPEEVEMTAMRAQGAGGQNVNKVSSAIHLRFDIRKSSLPEAWKERLLALSDQRITNDGAIVIKAQQFRTQEKNREDAMRRLVEIVARVATVPKARRATRPSRSSQRKRVDSKVKRGQIKALRGRITD